MRTGDYHYRYARPSFAEGVARIMDFGNALGAYNFGAADDSGDADPDTAALRADWAAIGGDFRHAVTRFAAEESARLVAVDKAAGEE